jgi:flavin reductase (DIM6/NTAB) family NADH-FMN oxidoreductase RutF
MTALQGPPPTRIHKDPSELLESLRPYRYPWPATSLSDDSRWTLDDQRQAYYRSMPETDEEVAADSRWPAMFPAPICLVTTTDGKRVALEREVGASIVNRFPYVVALSICRQKLSSRHHVRGTFMDILESGGVASLQFLAPGDALDAALSAIAVVPEHESSNRIAKSGLKTRKSVTNDAPVLTSAYMVYETKLVKPQKDFVGVTVYENPWVDVGSHRIYFLEINAIQLRQDIATGRSQIRWRALPAWQPMIEDPIADLERSPIKSDRYQKGYTPHYSFPAPNTIAFEHDEVHDGMAIKHLPPLPKDQVEVDNDRARWPSFFPSACGLITTWADDGTPNLMPCGSTTVVSRHPLVISPCVSYAKINDRYAPRVTLDIIRKTGKFGCGVPYISETIINAMKYAGNNSLAHDPNKILNSGLHVEHSEYGPVLKETPVHFDCQVTGEIRLGTHIMFLGEVKRIRVRADVTPENPLEWCPWATVTPVPQKEIV